MSRTFAILLTLAVLTTVVISGPAGADVQPAPGQVLVRNDSTLNGDGTCAYNTTIKYAAKPLDNELAFRARQGTGCQLIFEWNDAGTSNWAFSTGNIESLWLGSNPDHYPAYTYQVESVFTLRPESAPCWTVTAGAGQTTNPHATSQYGGLGYAVDTQWDGPNCVTVAVGLWLYSFNGNGASAGGGSAVSYPNGEAWCPAWSITIACVFTSDVEGVIDRIDTGSWAPIGTVGTGGSALLTVH